MEVTVMMSRIPSFLLWTGALVRPDRRPVPPGPFTRPGVIGQGPAPPGWCPIHPTWATLVRCRVPGWRGDGT